MVAWLQVRVNEGGAVLLRDSAPALIGGDNGQVLVGESDVFAQQWQRHLSDAAASDHDDAPAKLQRCRRAVCGTHKPMVTREPRPTSPAMVISSAGRTSVSASSAPEGRAREGAALCLAIMAG